MAIQGFCPPSPPSHSPPSHSPYYQLLERGSARLGRVKKQSIIFHVKVYVIGIEAQIWSISNPKLAQNWSKIGPRWSNGYKKDQKSTLSNSFIL